MGLKNKTPEERRSIWNRNYQKKKLKKSHQDAQKARMKIYRQNNKAKINAANASRRASKFQATPKWANREKIKHTYLLAKQQEEMTGQEIHVDHIVPLKSKIVCGLHNEFNLQIVNGSYNARKNNRTWPDMP